MSKTSNTKQITKIVIDEANGLTHVYMSDLSPKIVKANTSAPTNIPTKSEFSFRDESVESQAVVEKAFDEVFPERNIAMSSATGPSFFLIAFPFMASLAKKR